MPELPEVETVRRGAARYLCGRRLDEVELRRPDLRWPIPVAGVRALRGRRCSAVARRSKYLLLHFDGPGEPVALVHLGMSGRLFVDASDGDAVAEVAPPPWQRHEHWRMRFGDRLLRYVDARRFGMLYVTAGRELDQHWLLSPLGPEPLESGFTCDYLRQRTRGRRVATKSFLMDQKNVVGVGNIYASEACFGAGIRPGKAARRLTGRECERLVGAVREVLSEAIEAGGTTVKDYVGVDQRAGYFQRELRVYGRFGEPCTVCGASIKRTVVAQRSTYYCPFCQS